MIETETREGLRAASGAGTLLHLIVVESGLRRVDLGAFVFDVEMETDIIVQDPDESFTRLGRRVAQRIGVLERGQQRTVKATLVVGATRRESSMGERSLVARGLASHLSRCGGGELLLLAPEVYGNSLRHELLSITDLLLRDAPSSLRLSVILQEPHGHANRRKLVQLDRLAAGPLPSLLRRSASSRRKTFASRSQLTTMKPLPS